jgi:hypothetical protein
VPSRVKCHGYPGDLTSTHDRGGILEVRRAEDEAGDLSNEHHRHSRDFRSDSELFIEDIDDRYYHGPTIVLIHPTMFRESYLQRRPHEDGHKVHDAWSAIRDTLKER